MVRGVRLAGRSTRWRGGSSSPGWPRGGAGSMAGGLGFFEPPPPRPISSREGPEKPQFGRSCVQATSASSRAGTPRPGTDTAGRCRAQSQPRCRNWYRSCCASGPSSAPPLPGARVNTSEDDHGKGQYLVMTRAERGRAAIIPLWGRMRQGDGPRGGRHAGHIVLLPWGGAGRGSDAAYLGPRYSGVPASHRGSRPARRPPRAGQRVNRTPPATTSASR